MKSKVFIIASCMSIVMTGCQKDNQETAPTISKGNPTLNATTASSGANVDLHTGARYGTWTSGTSGSEFISIIDANLMIGSYLYSIHSEKNDSDLRSFSVDANMLRAYLADSSVKNVKLIFAHTLEYINGGHIGHYAGYQTGAMTIIIAAYNADGNYVFHDGMVLDRATPCPWTCPKGIAGSDLLY